jgi:hypothetical protein
MFIALVWWRVRDRAKPFLVTGALIIAEVLALAFASDFAAVKRLDVFVGHAPGPVIWLIGFAIGAATSWAGWNAGKRPQIVATAAAVPA